LKRIQKQFKILKQENTILRKPVGKFTEKALEFILELLPKNLNIQRISTIENKAYAGIQFAMITRVLILLINTLEVGRSFHKMTCFLNKYHTF
jgi:hypothetical protein